MHNLHTVVSDFNYLATIQVSIIGLHFTATDHNNLCKWDKEIIDLQDTQLGGLSEVQDLQSVQWMHVFHPTTRDLP